MSAYARLLAGAFGCLLAVAVSASCTVDDADPCAFELTCSASSECPQDAVCTGGRCLPPGGCGTLAEGEGEGLAEGEGEGPAEGEGEGAAEGEGEGPAEGEGEGGQEGEGEGPAEAEGEGEEEGEPETCNGLDDDGDGEVDEGVPNQVDVHGIEWVCISGGTYMMGDPTGGEWTTPHEVTIPTFWLAKTEVTVGQYQRCVNAGVCAAPHWEDETCIVGPNPEGGWLYTPVTEAWRETGRPVSCVTWDEATAYAIWAGARLPSESEWEYAARGGGRDQSYPWGDAAPTCELAVFNDGRPGCGLEGPAPVCSRPAGNSVHGLCDLSGNVSERVQDWFGPYEAAPVNGEAQADPRQSGGAKINRTGGWWSDAGNLNVRTMRGRNGPALRAASVGFRLARSACSPEVCNGLDDDCDGAVDSAPCNGCIPGTEIPDGFVCVPPTGPQGFVMGSPESEPEREWWEPGSETQHSVVITRPFLIKATDRDLGGLRRADLGS